MAVRERVRGLGCAASLALVGCTQGHATITLDGVRDFGEVKRAQWIAAPVLHSWSMLTNSTVIWPSASEPSQLILSDYAVSCEQTNAELKAWTDASEALLDALDGGNDVRDACAEMSTLADLADARNAARPADRRVFAANFAAADGAEGVGTWTEDDDTWGILSYYSQTSGCDTWNRDTCSFDADAGSCVYQRWDAVDPVLEITHVGSAITGTFDAGLAEADTDEDAGTIHVEFHAPICSMEGLGDSIVAF